MLTFIYNPPPHYDNIAGKARALWVLRSKDGLGQVCFVASSFWLFLNLNSAHTRMNIATAEKNTRIDFSMTVALLGSNIKIKITMLGIAIEIQSTDSISFSNVFTKRKHRPVVSTKESVARISSIEGLLAENRNHMKFISMLLIVNQRVMKPTNHNVTSNNPLVNDAVLILLRACEASFFTTFIGLFILIDLCCVPLKTELHFEDRITYTKTMVVRNERIPPISGLENHPQR